MLIFNTNNSNFIFNELDIKFPAMPILFSYYIRECKTFSKFSIAVVFIFLLCFPKLAICLSDTLKNKRIKISSSFNPTTFSWNVDWPGRISQYDLVYKSPPADPMQGIALGNGEVAALVWCEESKIIIIIQ